MAQWDSRSALEAGANELSDSDRVVLERYAAFNRTITMPGGSAQQQFEAAVQLIRGLPKNGPFQPSNDMKLRLYGFFKQATEGPCTQPAPSFWDVIGKAKWGAWKNLGDMPPEQAMTSYVDEIKKVMETMSLTDDVANLMDTLGPVYEYVDEDAAGRPSRKKHVRFSADEEPPAATNGHEPEVTEAEAADAEAAETGVESEAHPAGQNGVSAPIPVDNGRAPSQQRQQQERWAGSPTSDTDDDEEFNDPIGEADSLSGGRLSTEARLDALHQQLTALSRLMDSAGAAPRPHQSTAVAQLTNGVKAGPPSSSSAGASTCAGVHDELRALVRDMRDDLDTVTGRLRRLEAAHISSAASEKVAVRPWWQVPELSAGSVAVLLAWPLVLQLVLRLISSRRRR